MKTSRKARTAAKAMVMATLMLMTMLPLSVFGSAPAEDLEPITFYVFDCSLNKQYDDFLSPVAKEIERRTGVTLKVESAVGGDPAEKLMLMLAAGDYPDIIFPELSAGAYYDAGALLEVGPLMEEHAPNLMELYKEYMPRLSWSAEDQRIFKIGARTVYNEVIYPNSRTWIQHAVLQEFGYPEIKTLEQLEQLLKDYVAKYPEINGLPTIPLLAQIGRASCRERV